MPPRTSRKRKAWLSKGRRAPTYARLKREADSVFSQWVRRKDADSEGLVCCVTCGQKEPWKQMQCSHFISRVHLATRFDERNAHPGCYSCNVLRRGNVGEYALFLTRTYGPQVLQELVDKKRESVKYTRSDLESLIASYKARLEALV